MQDAALKPACVTGFKWHCGSHHKVKQNTHCPDIYVLTNVAFLFKQLRGCIRRRTTGCVEDIAEAAGCTKTKITHFNAVCAGVKDILSLQVPVDDIIIMLEKEKERLLKLFYNLITDSSTFFKI